MGKRGHPLSEHEDFVKLGMRTPEWAMLVGLIGEGQEIHLGEEGGLRLWSDAIKASGADWTIHCPQHVASVFDRQKVVVDDALELKVTLRSHASGGLHNWVKHVLDGQLSQASSIAHHTPENGCAELGRRGTVSDARHHPPPLFRPENCHVAEC
jgi:hypothetical protein